MHNDPATTVAIARGVALAVRTELDAVLADFETRAAQALAAYQTALDNIGAGALQSITTRALDLIERAATVKDGAPGPKGDAGEPGPPGTIAAAVPYAVGEIYKAGALVTLPREHPDGWAMARALVDTYDIPGDPDSTAWQPLLYHGRGFAFRGVHMPGQAYATGDVVLSPGGSLWIREHAGASDRVPGPDWQLFLKRGATGGRGRQGDPGEPGAPGADAPCIEAIGVEHGQLVTLLTDGTLLACALPVELTGGAQ